MTVAENLLRLYRWQIEERRRYLVGLESLGERLRADAERLAAEIASALPEGGLPALPDSGRRRLAERLIERKQKLEHSLAEIEKQIVEARAAMLAAENELARRGTPAAQRSDAGPVRRYRRLRNASATAAIPVRNKR